MSLSMEKSNSFRAVGFGSLMVLSVALPFELKKPLFSVGPFAITSVEICIYLAVAFWAAGWLAGVFRYWTSVHTIAAGWAGVLVISACLSSAHTGEALKFALRSMGGCALFFAAAEFVSSSRSAALVGMGLLAGSCLSALAAFAEIRLPGAASILGVFKTEPSMSGSFLRASGTFQYANIASMYWEAALPLALTFPAWWGVRRFRQSWWWIGLIFSIVLLEAILLTVSRSGILIAFLILVSCFQLSRHSIRLIKSLSLAALSGLILFCVVPGATGDMLWLRLTTPDLAGWYRAGYEEFPRQLTLDAGDTARVPLTIRNEGRIAWRAQGTQAVEVTYHWLDESAERILIWDGARSSIPSNVEPGETLKIAAWIRAPGKPGKYVLQWDMLQEHMTWFSIMGPSRSVTEVTVLPSSTGEIVLDDFPPVELPLPSQPARVDLWRAAARMGWQNPLFGVGPDNFRRLYGPYLGLKRFDDRIYANDLYFELFATVGLIGLLVFLAFLVAVFLKIRVAWRGAKIDEDKLILIGIGMALAAFCIHGLVDYFLPFTPTYGLFWILAGAAVGLRQKGEWT